MDVDVTETDQCERYLEFKNSTHINIVPRSMKEPKHDSRTPKANEEDDSGDQQKSTSVVITTVRDKTPSQVVLNFPIDAGNFHFFKIINQSFYIVLRNILCTDACFVVICGSLHC